MIANTLTVLAATAALLEPALAARHQHLHNRRVEKRADIVTATINGQVVTWENNYFPGGAEPTKVAVNDRPTTIVTKTLAKVTKSASAAADNVAVPNTNAESKKESGSSSSNAKVQSKSKSKSKSSSSSSGSSSSSSSSSSSGLSSKRGLCYNDASLANDFAKNCDNCGWAYNWGNVADGFSALNYIPMLWGTKNGHLDGFAENAKKAIANGAKAVLSFNEPDLAEQADMTPSKAAEVHGEHLKFIASDHPGVLIGSPAVTNNLEAADIGLGWLKQFRDACTGDCTYDFCAVHWYNSIEYGESLFDLLDQAREACDKDKKKPIWLTEFAPTGSDEEVAAWLKKAIPRLEALDYLHAYSYFMVADGKLMSGSSMNSLGEIYASA